MPDKRATSVTIAKKLGISQATVSMALRDDHRINVQTRLRVKETALQLNYIPNHMARAMKLGSTKMIAIIVPTISLSFYATAIDTIEQIAKKDGYYCLLAQTHSSAETLQNEIQLLLERGVDGLILYPLNSFEQKGLYTSLLHRKTPIVLCDEALDDLPVPVIQNDNVSIGRIATDHLIALGHRDIACITGHLGTNSAKGRLQGYKEALKNAKLPINPELIYEGSYLSTDGENAIKHLLTKRIRFTGLVSGNDDSALVAIQTLRTHGLMVPKDVSVVGVGNSPIGCVTYPTLSTVDQNPKAIAQNAIAILTSQIQRYDNFSNPFVIPSELIVRESTGPCSIRQGQA